MQIKEIKRPRMVFDVPDDGYRFAIRRVALENQLTVSDVICDALESKHPLIANYRQKLLEDKTETFQKG